MRNVLKTVVDVLIGVTLLLSVVLSLSGFGYMYGYSTKESKMIERCKETGMYLTEGYALSCKVLENNQ